MINQPKLRKEHKNNNHLEHEFATDRWKREKVIRTMRGMKHNFFFRVGIFFWVFDFCFASSTNLRKKANFSQLITSNARWVQNLVEKKVTTKQLALARGFRLKLELTDTT